MMKQRVHAVVVTYNRKEVLVECITAILNQTYMVEKIVIVDNCSTDGTKDYLKRYGYLNNKYIEYHELNKNCGGAGGFYEGIKAAKADEPDWIWIMDDDVVSTSTALMELVHATEYIKGKISFLASSVRGVNNEAMNVPKIDRRQFSSYTDWYEYLDEGIVKICKATFVSLLINIDAVKKCGLPWKEFFIWGDDSEYTQRVIRDYGSAYMVGKSKVVHKRFSAEALNFLKETNEFRIPLYFYYYRNNLIDFWEYESILYRFLCMGKLGYDFILILIKGKYKKKKMRVILKAFFAFVTGSYGRKSFANRKYE